MPENPNVRPASCRTSASEPENSVSDTQNRIDESAVCEYCGRIGAAEFGDHKICVDCYQSRCSCCCESECDINADA